MANLEEGFTIMDVKSSSTCNQAEGKIIDVLSLNVTSAFRWNRTPIQCIAQATSRQYKSFFSTYAVLLVESPPRKNYYRQK